MGSDMIWFVLFLCAIIFVGIGVAAMAIIDDSMNSGLAKGLLGLCVIAFFGLLPVGGLIALAVWKIITTSG